MDFRERKDASENIVMADEPSASRSESSSEAVAAPMATKIGAFETGRRGASGRRDKNQKPSNTGDSRAIPQPSTNPAQPCLSSMF